MAEAYIPFKKRLEALKIAIKWTYESSRRLAVLVLIVSVFGGLLTVVEPYIFRLIIDSIVSGKEITLGLKIGIGLAGLLVVYAVARILTHLRWDIQTIVRKLQVMRLEKHSSKILMEKVSSLDVVYFEDPNYYNMLTKANQNMGHVNEFFWQFTFFVG